jgi:uncharacterized protein
MDKEQVLRMKDECLFPDSCRDSDFLETHISWIVLTDHYAFKVKRPVKFSFLDFSTIEERRFFCQQEVKLNKRLAPDMYLGVIPISKSLKTEESDNNDHIIDYAVQMKRMDNDKEMHKMLIEDKVAERQLDKLAEKIARFHKNTPTIKSAFNTAGMLSELNDINSVLDRDPDNQLIAEDYKKIVWQCIETSTNYLNNNRSFLNERIINGYQRDCHGDLNATNIFLYDDPVIFDCIEFNEEFRYIDILNEVAFLSVDLDFYGRSRLSDSFIKSYKQAFGLKERDFPDSLFNFYKCYRANIRAKVTLLSMKDSPDDQKKQKDVKGYIHLMKDYSEVFKGS